VEFKFISVDINNDLYSRLFQQSLAALLIKQTASYSDVKFYKLVLIIKPTRCTNFSNLFYE